MSAKELSERQEIVEKFQRMRDQQKEIAGQLHEIDEDRREHKFVVYICCHCAIWFRTLFAIV